MKFIIIIYTTNKLTVVEMEDIRGVRLRKFKLRKIVLGVRMHFHHTCSQLTLEKIIKIVATKCQILRLKCTKFNFGWGSAQTPLGELTALPQIPQLD